MEHRLAEHTAERIAAIDILRGLAVAGIFLINVHSFLLLEGRPVDAAASPGQAAFLRAVEMFALGKFHIIFAFLFGASAAIFMGKRDPAHAGLWPYARRMGCLLLIGVAHGSVWGGDVLLTYAVCGFILPLFKRLATAWLIAIGLFLAFFYDLFYVAHHASRSYAQGAVALPRLAEALVFAKSLGHMLLGMAAFRADVFRRDSRAFSSLRGVLPALLAGTLAIWAWSLNVEAGPLLHAMTFNLAIIPATLYAVLVLLLIVPGNRRVAAAGRLLQSYGRLALTHYLMQTVIGLMLLPALTATGPLNAAELSCLCVAVWASQIAFSQLWLRRFNIGPIEWLWRCATYMRVQPLTKAAAAQ